MTARDGQSVLATGGAVFAVTGQSRIEIVGGRAQVGFDGNDGGKATLSFEPGATLAFKAADGALGRIGEFRTGAFGDAPDVRSRVELGNATLDLDLSGIDSGMTEACLIKADEVSGRFGRVEVSGLEGRTATIDYAAGTVLLRLTKGALPCSETQ